MSQALDDLNAAETELAAAVTAGNAEIDTLVDQLASLHPEDDSEEIEDVVSKIKGLTSSITSKVSSVGKPAEPVDATPATA